MTHPLSPFFSPSGVAIIGASANPAKLSHGILKNLKESSYRGKVYPVNPGSTEILGYTTYADISQVPDPVELAVSVLPAPLTPDTLRACGERGIRAVIIISGGFKEVGAAGEQLEQQCLEIARQYGMRLIGPNCVGTMDLFSGLNTTFIKGMPARGSIGFLSQSGAVCGAVVDIVSSMGIGFSNFSSLGNEADINETDIIEYLAQDDNTKVIAAYVEAVQNGSGFIEAVSRVTPYKPVLVLKAGRTGEGARAVSSHTGSLAGSHTAYQAAFERCGALEVTSGEELFNLSLALTSPTRLTGNRVAILTNSGGPAALASDSLAQHSLTLASLSAAAQQSLREKLVPSAQAQNPVDMLGGATPLEYEAALNACLADDQVDAVLTILTPQALVNPLEVAQAMHRTAADQPKPVIACLMGGASIQEARFFLNTHNIPMYVYPEQAAAALGALLRRSQWLSGYAQQTPAEADAPAVLPPAVDQILQAAAGAVSLGEFETRPILQSLGIPIAPGGMAADAQQAAHLAEQIGCPVVMKIVSQQILHKSDAGGVLLNLQSPAEAAQAFEQLTGKIKASHPAAVIQGVLVEKMAPKGIEVILGMRRDPTFGPLMMFGLGGVFVELFSDVAFALAPLNREQALRMIEKTKAARLLRGLRGASPADLDAVVDCLVKLSHFALNASNVAEFEINPLLVYPHGQGVLAIDSRAILVRE